MSLIYDVPTIADSHQFAQRGPTCWYYASKMLLKFHHKLDDKGDDVYEEFKTLHEVRKVMTESGDKSAETITEELKRRAKSMDGYIRAIQVLEGKQSLNPSQQESLDFLRAASPAERKQRILEAIKKLDEQCNKDLSRLNLLTSFVPNGGFNKVNKEQYDSAEKVLDLLQRWGPFYTGGTVVAERKNINATGKLAGTTQIVNVTEFKSTGSHAIVVVGAGDNIVYYKDPHNTNQIRSMDMATFHKGLDVDASDFLIAINCWDGWNYDLANCVHTRTQTVSAQ